MFRNYYFPFIFTFISFVYTSSYGQAIFKGKVLDSDKGTPIKGAIIRDSETNDSAVTNAQGFFSLIITNPNPSRFTFEAIDHIGFDFDFFWYDTLEVNTYYLTADKQELETVIVRKKKEKYRNKNNPAVDLIRKVIEHKDENRMNANEYSTFNAYEKINVSTTNIPKWVKKFILFRPFRYIFENVDSNSLPGYKIMPTYIEEIWSKNYDRKSPSSSKKIITANKKISFDDKYVNEEGAVDKLKHLYQDINIYDNDFILVSNSFLSPTNPLSPTFYKFYIMDTVMEGNNRIIRLDFEPRNTSDLLLRGRMMVSIDENFAITSVEMTTSKFVNINFIKNMVVEQKFRKAENGKYYAYFDRNYTQFVLFDGLKQGMIGERVVHRDSFKILNSIPDSIFTEPITEKKTVDSNYNLLDYEMIRPVSLSSFEYRTYRDIDSMRNSAYYKALIKFSYIASKGYIPLGKYEIGPLYRTLSFNPVEGYRVRAGIRNNNLLIRNYNFNTYIAYGFNDKKIKYLVSGMYSLNGKGIFEYPMHYIKVQAQQENKVPGRIFETSVQDNIFETIQRGRNDKFLNVRDFMAEYMIELPRNLQVSTDIRYMKQSAMGALYFIKNNAGFLDTIPHIISNSVGLKIRWAPGEKFMVNRASRYDLLHQKPIFTLRGEIGIPGILGSDIAYKKLSLAIQKRNNLGPLGFLDARVSGNIIWGTLPYHLLNIPRANQGYTYSFQSYMLMNNGEFVSDRQVELSLNYRMMGFILNKIPLIKRLKLREVAGFKLVYGNLSPQNNPNKNSNQFLFPTDEDGRNLVNEFGKTPYMEYNVGLENILKLIRIDYVRRLTYLDNPFINKEGIRVSLIFNF